MESGLASSEYNRSHSDANRIEEQSDEDSSNGPLEAEDNVDGSRRAFTKSTANGKAPRVADSAGSDSSKKRLLATSAPTAQPKKGSVKEPLPVDDEEAGLK